MTSKNTLTSDPAILSYGISPLAQTFRTTTDAGASGKWIYAVNLLFARKTDQNNPKSFTSYSGVTVEIRKTLNGYPMGPDSVIARTHVISDEIDVLSTDATSLDTSKYTTFTFLEPAFLQNNEEYAIVVYPDGNSTDYLAWVGRIGETVFATNLQYSSQDTVTPGVLFLSTNQTSWTPVQTEDLVYDVRTMTFDESSGDITLVPNDYEFITFDALINKKFNFNRASKVGQLTNTYGNGYFLANSGTLITGPAYALARPFVDSSIQVGAFQINSTPGSDNFSSINSGDGIIILRIEPDMVSYSPAANGYTWVSSITGGSTTVLGNTTGNSTLYNTVLQVGDFIVIPNVSNTDHSNTLFSVNANGQQFGCIRQVVSIANNSQFTIDCPISATTVTNTAFWVANNIKAFISTIHSGNNTTLQLKDPITTAFVAASNGDFFAAGAANIAYAYQAAPVGRVDGINTITNKLRIEGSTANTLVKFNPSNSTYLGTLISTNYANTTSFSTAYANLVSLDNIAIDRISSKMRNFAPLGTTIDAEITTNHSSTGNNTITKNHSLNGTQLITHDALLLSKSLNPSQESVSLKINLASDSLNCSPKLTVYPSTLTVHSAFINANTSNENWANNAGAALAKYVSKQSTLSSELDAEDVFVYVTAYRPSGTDIKVYIKIRAREDTRKINDIDWSELLIDTNADVYSSPSNSADYKEYRYVFRKKPQTTVITGTASYTNATSNLDGVGTTWSSNLAANDVIAIIDPTDTQVYDIGVVSSVANNTRVTLKSVLSDQGVFSSTNGLTIEKLTYPTEAFKYYGNDNVVRYYTDTQVAYDAYQQFAIKIVMTRDTLGVVPYINDVRAISTSV